MSARLSPLLVEKMEALAADFGLEACREALNIVSFSPRVRYCARNDPVHRHEDIILDSSNISLCKSDCMVDDVILKRNASIRFSPVISMSMRNAARVNSQAMENIVAIMDRCNSKRMDWLSYSNSYRDLGCYSNVLDRFCFDWDSQEVLQILDRPSIAVFRCLHIQAQQAMRSPILSDSLPERLRKIFIANQACSSLKISNFTLQSRHTMMLKEIMTTSPLRELSLDNIFFEELQASLKHITEALKQLKQHPSCNFESFELICCDSTGHEVPEQDLIQSLSGNLQLKSVCISTPGGNGRIPSLLLNHVLLHHSCRIERLLVIKDDDDDDSDIIGMEERAVTGTHHDFAAFASGLSRCQSLRNLEIDFTSKIQDVKDLWRLAVSPGSSLSSIIVPEADFALEAYFDLFETLSQPLPGQHNFSRVSGVRQVVIADGCRCLFPKLYPYLLIKNLFAMNTLLRHQMPYLYEIGMSPEEWRDLRISHGLQAQLARQGSDVRFDGITYQPITGTRDDPRSAGSKAWDDLRLQLELNYTGVALLKHAGAVPVALWPMVLARAASEHKRQFIWSDPNDPDQHCFPLNGLFALVKGVLTGGLSIH